jgi:prepilin-type N-terminal cleavage/methylation domain-containing protein
LVVGRFTVILIIRGTPRMQQTKYARTRLSRQQGFSLMELMTVVVIVGVLSAMAVPTFSDYVYKSRTTEATEFLGVIRLREEAYRAEFGAYCPTVPDDVPQTAIASLDREANLVPNPTTTRRNSATFVATAPWLQLGASPSGPVRFGYGVVAGPPGTGEATLGFNTRPDFWWVARAVGDLDADGVYVMFETYSSNKGIFIGHFPSAAPNDKGWE